MSAYRTWYRLLTFAAFQRVQSPQNSYTYFYKHERRLKNTRACISICMLRINVGAFRLMCHNHKIMIFFVILHHFLPVYTHFTIRSVFLNFTRVVSKRGSDFCNTIWMYPLVLASLEPQKCEQFFFHVYSRVEYERDRLLSHCNNVCFNKNETNRPLSQPTEDTDALSTLNFLPVFSL